jgi:hypothetical protein
MEKKTKIDKIIDIIREQMVAGTGGFTSSADPKGPVAGFDPVIGKVQKRYMSGGRGSRKLWMQYLKNK